jgi:NAD(P)-dependent dehydrogenase (short-subunit alcohol dehydrogenase family)
MSSPGPLFIVGTGPMIGSEIPKLFASKTFTHIALFARTTATLSAAKDKIAAATPSATIKVYTADVIDSINLTQALEQAVTDLGKPEVVVFNAARINYGMFDDYTESDILTDFQIPNLGLYTTAKVLLPYLRTLAKEKPDSHPCLFVTSSPLIHQPVAAVFSLSMAKAAQASLTKMLAEQNKDVHVAIISVDGPVTWEEKINNPVNTAKKFWEAWEERGEWKFEYQVK